MKPLSSCSMLIIEAVPGLSWHLSKRTVAFNTRRDTECCRQQSDPAFQGCIEIALPWSYQHASRSGKWTEESSDWNQQVADIDINWHSALRESPKQHPERVFFLFLRMAPLSEGRVMDGKLMCSYHGWKVLPSGQVGSIPQAGMDPVPQDSPVQRRACTQSYPVKVGPGNGPILLSIAIFQCHNARLCQIMHHSLFQRCLHITFQSR